MLTYLVIISASLMAQKYDFPTIKYDHPISAETWEIGEDPQNAIYDAVIVEDHTEITSISINRYRKIRILSEKGKEAAQFEDPTGKAKDIKCRVVDISGNQVNIDKKEDLVEVLDFKSRSETNKTKILVPPGLTTDCVVELSWRVFASEGLPEGKYRNVYYIPEPFFVKKKRFKIDKGALRNRGGSYLVTRAVWIPAQPPAKFTALDTNARMLIYENVPALKAHPFGNMYLDPSAAFVSLFKTFPNFGSKPVQFWKRFGNEYLKDHMNRKFSKSKKYKAWIKELKARLPDDHVQAAIQVLDAVRREVSASDMLPPSKRAIFAEKGIETEHEAWLSMVFENGMAHPWQMCFVYYRAAMDCNLPIRVAFANPSTDSPVQASALDPFSLDLYSPFFAVKKGDNNWVFLSPAWQEYTPGFMPPHYQGGPAILFDPNNKWDYEIISTARFGPDAHQKIRQYAISIEEDGLVKFTVNEKGTGIYNSRKLLRYFPKTKDEQVEDLKEIWQDRMPSFLVSDASLKGVSSLDGSVEVFVSAEQKLDLSDNTWLALNPFPGDSLPVSTPNIWPENRKQPIILPHQLQQIDLAIVTAPEGWKLRGKPSWQKANSVGKVSFRAVQEENKITVRRDIILYSDIMGPDAEGELKYFLAWMNEAGYQNIGLDMGGPK